MLYPLSYRGTLPIIVLCGVDGFHSRSNFEAGLPGRDKKTKEKAPTCLVELVGASSEKEDMTLIKYRLASRRDFTGEQIVTSCEYTVFHRK